MNPPTALRQLGGCPAADVAAAASDGSIYTVTCSDSFECKVPGLYKLGTWGRVSIPTFELPIAPCCGELERRKGC